MICGGFCNAQKSMDLSIQLFPKALYAAVNCSIHSSHDILTMRLAHRFESHKKKCHTLKNARPMLRVSLLCILSFNHQHVSRLSHICLCSVRGHNCLRSPLPLVVFSCRIPVVHVDTSGENKQQSHKSISRKCRKTFNVYILICSLVVPKKKKQRSGLGRSGWGVVQVGAKISRFFSSPGPFFVFVFSNFRGLSLSCGCLCHH